MDNLKLWSKDDREPLGARTKEWQKILENLKLMELDIGPDAYNYHEYYFFNGDVHPDIDNADAYSNVTLYNIRGYNYAQELIFQMWYHPNPSYELFRDLCNRASLNNKSEIQRSAVMLHNIFKMGTCFQSDYGAFGGREPMIVKALLPISEHDQEFFLASKKIRRSRFLHPIRVVDSWLNCVGIILEKDNKNPYLIGQYFTDHIDCSFDKHYEDILKFENLDWYLRRMRNVMYKIIDFDDRVGPHRDKKFAIELKSSLFERFENNGFCDRLQKMWDDEKHRYSRGEQPISTEVVLDEPKAFRPKLP